MKLPSIQTTTISVFIAVAFSVLGRIEGARSAMIEPSVIIERISKADRVAVRGGELIITTRVTRKKSCRISIDRWLYQTYIDEKGKTAYRTYYLETGVAFPLPITDNVEIETHIHIPSYVINGDYLYQSVARDECSMLPRWLLPSVRQMEPINVVIGNPTSDLPMQLAVPPGRVEVVPIK